MKYKNVSKKIREFYRRNPKDCYINEKDGQGIFMNISYCINTIFSDRVEIFASRYMLHIKRESRNNDTGHQWVAQKVRLFLEDAKSLSINREYVYVNGLRVFLQ